ncbi:MAG TPA: hypothetical protein VKC63_07870 [Solirubrobacterales bacterium]|nr:hypothetical protein [Solirubrobacterales bacterium]
MPNKLGKIKAPPKTTAPAGGGDPPAPADTSLPDPTSVAKWMLAGMLLLALAVALIWNHFGHAGAPFMPAKDETANFALFAGFYAAAQVIERLLELVSPVLPFWEIPDPTTPGGAAAPVQMATAKAAQIKADRAAAAHGIAAVLGVAASCAFGLFFLQAVGFHASNTIDTFATGIIIAAGTKPLHDLISGLQNKNTPTTGTAT